MAALLLCVYSNGGGNFSEKNRNDGWTRPKTTRPNVSLNPHNKVFSLLLCSLSPTTKVFFNQPVIEVQWPEALLELDFGLTFDMPVEGVALPRGLQSLCFGRSFNQGVSRVAWPEGLERVGLGNNPVGSSDPTDMMSSAAETG